MTMNIERELLEKYALASNQKILDSQADLDPKDRPLQEMLSWCKRQGDIVVLKSGRDIIQQTWFPDGAKL